MHPVATVRSDYREKFAIPRQPGLVPAARASIELEPAWAGRGAFDGLEQATHVWVQFVFHAVPVGRGGARVRPPRLGGNRRLGVFATRSTHRPNAIGLSVVRLLAVEGDALLVAGADLLDGTPVLDIKPYLPWSDAPAEAAHGWAGERPERLKVLFSDAALRGLAACDESPRLRQLIEQSLALDPRPAYQRADSERVYGARLAGLEVKWRHDEAGALTVLSVAVAPGAGGD